MTPKWIGGDDEIRKIGSNSRGTVADTVIFEV